MVLLQVLVLLLAAFARPSRAVYCICKDGASKEAMQNDIDYACGSGADCNGILPPGPCYLPNTVKDHCNYAVNSYFQRQAQVTGSCNFSGSATTSAVIPNQVAGCVYQASPSSTTLTPPPPTGTGTTPSTGTPTMGTPTTGTPPAIPTTGTPPAIPTMGTPPATIVTPGLGPPSGTDFNNGATSMTLGKGTLFVVLLIMAGILG